MARASAADANAVADYAARCEASDGQATAPRAERASDGGAGPAVRMLAKEAALLHEDTTAAMAGMALQLHEQHTFTHACATDGGKAEGPDDDGDGVAEATAYGLVAYSSTGRRVLGGRLPAGSTVQDAEMAALLACVRWATTEAEGDQPVAERRLYVLSDSATQLREAEKAYRTSSAVELRTHDRRGAREELTERRARLRIAIMQFVRSHEGCAPNAHADAVATAFLRGEPEETSPRREYGEVEYQVAEGTAGPWHAVPADRGPRSLLLKRSQDYVVRWLRGDATTCAESFGKFLSSIAVACHEIR